MVRKRRPLSALPRLALVVVAGMALGASPSAEGVLDAEPPELRERLDDDGVVLLEEIGAGRESFIVALVVFEQPRERVRLLMKQAERQPEYRPELVSVKTIETLPDGGRIDEQTIKILFQKLVYRLRFREDADNGRITWTLDESFDNAIASMEGFWELYPFDGAPGRTLGRFGSSVDVGAGVPSFVQKGMSRKTVLTYVENLRKWIDSEGRWRP